MAKLKIYLDTSVVSFYFADDTPEKQDVTIEFFEKFLDKYDVSISRLAIAELENTADDELRNKMLDIIENFNINILDVEKENEREIFDLANLYVNEKVIPRSKFNDAVHIAICTYFGFDILLSWNFRHLSNIRKQMLVNSVNIKAGFNKDLFLLSPLEVIYEKT